MLFNRSFRGGRGLDAGSVAPGLPAAACPGAITGARDRATYRYLLFFCIALFTVQALFWSGGGPIWEAGGLEIHLQGVLYAVQVTLRLLILLCAWYLLITTTRPLDLVMDLEQRGLQPRLGYMILATLQAIGELQERAQQILEAQQCRGVEVQGGLIVRARAYLPAVAPLITSSILGIESRAAALELRGFSANSPKTILYKSEEQAWERPARWAFILLAAAVLVGRLAC